MVNKIKAIFAAIGSIGAVMLTVSALLWVFTQYPARVLEFLTITVFAYWGYSAYKYFLGKFEKNSDNKQINS